MADRPIDSTTSLAAQRNRLALERTMMAWVRTATSLIAFGFTLYQAFRYLATTERLNRTIVSPQAFGIAMIVVGLIALMLAWIQHVQELKALRAQFGPMPHSIAAVLAALVAGLGVIAILAVTLRL